MKNNNALIFGKIFSPSSWVGHTRSLFSLTSRKRTAYFLTEFHQLVFLRIDKFSPFTSERQWLQSAMRYVRIVGGENLKGREGHPAVTFETPWPSISIYKGSL